MDLNLGEFKRELGYFISCISKLFQLVSKICRHLATSYLLSPKLITAPLADFPSCISPSQKIRYSCRPGRATRYLQKNYLQESSDDINFVYKRCLKIKPSWISSRPNCKRPNYLRGSWSFGTKASSHPPRYQNLSLWQHCGHNDKTESHKTFLFLVL